MNNYPQELYAEVILPFPLHDRFTYRVPPDFQPSVRVGIRVIVQFGRRKFFSALVFRLHNDPPQGSFDLKNIDAILDKEPVVHPLQLRLWEWMANYYCCTLGEVYKAGLPSALKLESKTLISLNRQGNRSVDLTPEEEKLLLALQENGPMNIRELGRFAEKRSLHATLKILLERNTILTEERIGESYRPKTVAHVFPDASVLTEDQIRAALEKLKRAKKQRELFLFFLAETRYHPEKRPSIEKKKLLQESGASEHTLRSLAGKKLVRIGEVETDRLTGESPDEMHISALNEVQQQVYEKIRTANTSRPVLLYGVTSSGKTEIYIKLIEEQLARHRQVLYLVPEIGLTTQLINRLKKAFGGQAGIYHSRFSDAERLETWRRVQQGYGPSSQLILGTRSAVFLPFRELGLIIVDEEHESSFKQFDPAPRYHARDVGIVLGQLHRARVVLGTATPSFESYYNAKNGKYTLTELPQRFRNIRLPEMIVTDIRQAIHRKQMHAMLSPVLHREIERVLEQQEQVILFQNRRGFAPYLQCSSCGWIPRCSQCDVSLTYHKHTNALVCHYCGHAESLPVCCGECGSEAIRAKGFGTEKLEEELQLLFPEARIARMDLDTTRAKGRFERLIHQFENRQIDVLVGTQMVAKGLDFDHVSLVGILDADQFLSYPDFRSYERAYQLIAQVSGRAGRKNKQGKVIIQTSQPEHPVLQEVTANNYPRLFRQQMAERKLFRYPPYTRLVRIVLKHRNRERLDSGAELLAVPLRRLFGRNILGPEYPVINRIQNWYQKEIWIKLERDPRLSIRKRHILESLEQIRSLPRYSGLVAYADIDPQ
ncbi:MAG: primosomal protein N' [Mangrovibacterium sp.]